jgi:S1-C subfamily serine protease
MIHSRHERVGCNSRLTRQREQPVQASTKPIQSFFVFTLLLIGAPLLSSHLTQIDSLELEKTAVARVRIERPDGSRETASAVYVGKDTRYAYFATAFHAVAISKDSNAVVDKVVVEFDASPVKNPASVLSQVDPDLDLAVILVPVSSFSADPSQIAIRDPAPKGAIHIIGHPPAGGWSVWSGTVQNVMAGSSDLRHFTTTANPSLTGGYSGGPVYNAEGFLVGLHVDNSGSYARAARMSEVVRVLSSWRVPVSGFRTTSLSPSQPQEDPVKEACMNGSIVDCDNYSGSILVKCNPYNTACKLLAACWQDKARALKVVQFACQRNDQSCEFQKENMRAASQMDCDKKTLGSF